MVMDIPQGAQAAGLQQEFGPYTSDRVAFSACHILDYPTQLTLGAWDGFDVVFSVEFCWSVPCCPLSLYPLTWHAAILKRLEASNSGTLESPVNIELPPRSFLNNFPDITPKKCAYVLKDVEQAVRHATGLITIMKNAIIAKTGPGPHSSLFFGHYSTLLCESLRPLLLLQASWPVYVDMGVTSTIQAALDLATAESSSDIATAQSRSDKKGFAASQRASNALALLCSDILENPQLLLSEEDAAPSLRRVVSLAFVYLAKEAVNSRPLSTLIGYRLVPHVTKLASEIPSEHGDLLVS
jgi:hypothetical protein